MITQISNYLDLKPSKNVKVQQIFNNSVNLLLEDSLFTLQNNQTTLTPLSIVFDSLPTITLESKIEITKDSIIIDSNEYTFIGSTILDLRLVKQSFSGFDYHHVFNKCDNRSLLANWYRNKLNDDLSLLDQLIVEKLEVLIDRPFDFEYLSSLIGLGSGLTPSLDDFIIGCLFAYDTHNSPKFDLLVNAIKGNLNNTTPVSSAFLKAATNHYYSEPLINMINNPSETSVNNVTSYGHSSGLDTLTGFIFGLDNLERL